MVILRVLVNIGSVGILLAVAPLVAETYPSRYKQVKFDFWRLATLFVCVVLSVQQSFSRAVNFFDVLKFG